MVAPVNLHKLAEALPSVSRLVHMKCSRRAGQPDASLGEPPAQGLTTNVHTMQLHQFLVRQLRPEVRVPLAHEQHDLGLGFSREFVIARSAALARRQTRQPVAFEPPTQPLHLPYAQPHQRCGPGLCQSLFAHPTYQLASIDLFRGHRHKFLRHKSTHEHAPRVSKGTFLLGQKGTFGLGRYD